ncbi:MAG: hypothetical protein R2932_35950 [Caldilineaceae bacterium]
MFRPLFTAITSVTALTDRFVYPDLQPEQQRRRRFLFPLVLVGTTTSIIATAIGLNVQGLASVETLSSLISIVVCIGYLYALRYLKTIQFLLNALAIYYGLLVIYGLLVGAAVGTSYLWLYTYPLIAYFLLGQRGGFRMVALSWIASTLIITF